MVNGLKSGAVTAGGRRTMTARRRTALAEPYLYLIASAVLLAIVFLVPAITATIDSFTNAKLLGNQPREFVGFDNYAPLFTPDFGEVILRTIVWVVLSVGGACVIGFLLAVLFDKPMPGRTIFRIIIVLPWIFPESLVAVMWKWTLNPGYGFLTTLAQSLGLFPDGIDFFAPDRAFITVLILNIWRITPFVFLAVLAALQAIPEELDQAAKVDGASAFQRLRYIKFPLVLPVLGTTAVILAAWTMVNFDLVFVLTSGGPNGATELLAIRIYEAGFQQFDLGLASAMATATVVLVMAFGYFYVRKSVSNAR